MRINGRYTVVGALGAGSHGAVFRVRDSQSEEDELALKLLRPGQDHALLRWEFDQLRQLAHPHLAPVIEVDSVDAVEGGQQDAVVPGAFFFTQRLVAGLAAHEARHQVEGLAALEPWVARVGGIVARVLAYLHGRGIVHRDVKPSNIIVGQEPGEVYLMDLALATSSLTPATNAAGSLAYMAPEALRGAPEAASDLFSLGVTLYELLTGQRPFGDGVDPSSTVRALLGGQFQPLTHRLPGVNVQLAQLVDSLLAPEPRQRPGPARKVAFDLARMFGGDTVGLDVDVTGVALEGDGPECHEHQVALTGPGALLERDRELATLLSFLEQRLDAKWTGSPIIALTGPAGVGKSALAREAVHRFQLHALANEAAPPLVRRGGISQVLAGLLAESQSEADQSWPHLHSWLAETGVEVEELREAPDPSVLWEEGARLLSEATRPRPLVVHLDVASGSEATDFLLYLHRRSEVAGLTEPWSGRFAVIGELRLEGNQESPFSAAIDSLELAPLSDAKLATIAQDRLGRTLPPDLWRAACAVARGRPFLLLAYLSGLASQRAFDSPSFQAELAGEQALSADAQTVLDGALTCLSQGQRDALHALALWGREAGGADVAALLGCSTSQGVQLVGELWRLGWLELDDRRRAARVPADLRLSALQRDRMWRVALARRAVTLLAGPVLSTEDAADLASHAVEGEMGETAGGYCLEAGLRLLSVGDSSRAMRFLAQAIQHGSAEVEDKALRSYRRAALAAGQYDDLVTSWSVAAEAGDETALLPLAEALRRAGRADEARQWARRALQREPHRARAILARLELDRGAAQQALATAHAPQPGQCAATAALEEVTGLARLALGDIRVAEAHFQQALELVPQQAPEEQSNLFARAQNLLGMAAHRREDWSAAVAYYGQAETRARQAGLLHAAAMYGVNLATARLEQGDLGAALAPLRQALHTLAGVGRTGELAAALYNYGALLQALGDVDNAHRVHKRALAAAREAGASQVEAYCCLLAGDLQGRVGQWGEAQAAYARAVELFLQLAARREQALAQFCWAAASAAAGESEQARRQLRRGLELVEPDDSPECHGRRALARGRLALLDVASPREMADAMDDIADTQRLRGERLAPELRWRLVVVGALLRQRRGQLEAARREAAQAASLVEAQRRQLPEHYVELWSRDRDLEALAALQAQLALAESVSSQPMPDRYEPRGSLLDVGALRRVLTINKRLNSELRLGRLLDEIIDTIVDLTDAERGFLLLREADGSLRARSARNLDRRSVDSDDLSLSRSLAAQVVASAEPLLTVDAQADGRFDAAASVQALRLRSILAVPLRVKGEVVGAVYVDDRLRRGAFGEADLQLALHVADQAAIAIENARLLAENRRRQREVAALNQELQRDLDRQRVELAELRRELGDQRGQLGTKYAYEAIIARSEAMSKVFNVLDRITDSDVSVVLQGESGTGKELVARAIHFNGDRREKPFVTENCGAIPETLLESALFGHVKGAFTGAVRDRAGLFEVATGGTLLLDEVSEMTPAMQAKLLRVLQEGEVRPVGGNRTISVNVRVVASSNKDLGQLVRDGGFRQDLFYRLNVITVRLPPLRERREDIPLLIDHFLKKHENEHIQGVDDGALRLLSAYHWPGNVRQLQNEIMRVAVLAEGTIREEHLSPEIGEPPLRESPDDLDLRAHVENLERRLISQALAQFNGNQSRAAGALGLSRYGLQKKMARYGVTASRRSSR
jgi:transcriptional regulator with GAF, ATPase, and Fis domain